MIFAEEVTVLDEVPAETVDQPPAGDQPAVAIQDVPAAVNQVGAPAEIETKDEVTQLLERVANAQTFNELHKASTAADDWADKGDSRCVKVYREVVKRGYALRNEIIKRAESEFDTSESMITMYYYFRPEKLNSELVTVLDSANFGLYDNTINSTLAKLSQYIYK